MRFEGRLRDGQGDCSKWTPELLQHYRRISGLDLVPGTLNVELDVAVRLPSTSKRLRAHEWSGPHDVLLAACLVEGHRGVVIRTEPNNLGHGPLAPTLLEIASDMHYRTSLNLKSGDTVDVDIDVAPRYATGDAVQLGDRVGVSGVEGSVMFVVERDEWSAEFPKNDWCYLKRGFMVKEDDGTLIHYEEADESVALLGRRVADS